MRHIVFDVDGTLIDTERAVLCSLRDTLAALEGRERPLDELTFALGITGEDALRRLEVADIPDALERWSERMAAYHGEVRPFSGVEELLSTLVARGYGLGIVTSETRAELESEFLPHGLGHYFRVMVCADDTAAHKPFPEPLLRYAALADARPEEIVYVGDSPYDLCCAALAGTGFILARWGAAGRVPARDSLCAERPWDIPALLERLG